MTFADPPGCEDGGGGGAAEKLFKQSWRSGSSNTDIISYVEEKIQGYVNIMNA